MDNYKQNIDGIIQQINRKSFDYENAYLDAIYPGDEHKFKYTNYMRLGYITGALGRIPKSVLEVGYGKGYFLEACSEIIPEVYGYDVASSPVPEKCIKVNEEQFLSNHYDVICFWDALEHFDQIEFVEDLDCEVISVSLPWCHYNSIDYWEGHESADEWFESWKHRKENEHLWHFDDDSIVKFFRRMGYTPLHIPFNLEDTTRKGPNSPDLPNILTCSFRKV